MLGQPCYLPSLSWGSSRSLALVMVELSLRLEFWSRTLRCLARTSLKRDETSRALEACRWGTAVLGREQDTNPKGCPKASKTPSLTGFPPGPHPHRKRPAETYKDSHVSGGAARGPRRKDFLAHGVLHSDTSQMDSCWQPDDHLALMPL